MKRIIAAFAAVAAATWAAAVFTSAGVAHADDYTYVPLPADEPFWPTDEAPLPFLWVGAYLQKGESRRVTDQLEISQNALEEPEVDNEVQCIDNLGDEQDMDNGTNYLEGGQAYQWNVSMLLTNQGPQEAFYLCKVLVHLDTGFPMAVLAPAAGQTTYGTWLEMSSSADTGAQQWWYPYPPGSQCICCSNDSDSAVNPSPCVYLGGPNPNNLSIDYWPNPDGSYQLTWSASSDATVVDFAATMQVTVCFQYTGSCRRIDDGPGDNSTIRSGLVIKQHYPPPAGFAEGPPCGNATVVYSEDTVNGNAETAETLTVSKYQHHLPLYYHATVPVSQLCGGSRTFSMSLYTKLEEGDPIKYDGGNLNVINLERAPTTTVPNVIGLNQDKATAAIEAAGLTASTECSPAPSPYGVVLTQNSPGDIVEPTGSPVQITLSCGLLHP